MCSADRQQCRRAWGGRCKALRSGTPLLSDNEEWYGEQAGQTHRVAGRKSRAHAEEANWEWKRSWKLRAWCYLLLLS